MACQSAGWSTVDVVCRIKCIVAYVHHSWHWIDKNKCTIINANESYSKWVSRFES